MRQWNNITGAATSRGRNPLGAVQYALPVPTQGVSTLMHVGNYEIAGLGEGLGPDLSGTARTVGWVGAVVWAYARFGSRDKQLEQKSRVWALGGFAASFLL